jgi:hypothetical protein
MEWSYENGYDGDGHPLEEERVYMEGQVGRKDDIINLITSRAEEGEGGCVEGKPEYSCRKCHADVTLRE